MTRGGPRPGAGRKPSAAPKDHRVMVRLSDFERETCERAADSAGVSLSAWMRAACVRAATRRR